MIEQDTNIHFNDALIKNQILEKQENIKQHGDKEREIMMITMKMMEMMKV